VPGVNVTAMPSATGGSSGSKADEGVDAFTHRPDLRPAPVRTTSQRDHEMSLRAAAVAQILRVKIERGDYRQGVRLPSQAEMSETLGVGMRAIGKAIAELKATGHVEIRPYFGMFVRPREHWRTTPKTGPSGDQDSRPGSPRA
jgi:DNA-binding FadR family transcriptional regulator